MVRQSLTQHSRALATARCWPRPGAGQGGMSYGRGLPARPLGGKSLAVGGTLRVPEQRRPLGDGIVVGTGLQACAQAHRMPCTGPGPWELAMGPVGSP